MNMIMKILGLILLLSVFVLPVSASIHNVTGYIMEDGTGLLGVTVTDNESIDTTVTNATGYYKLEGYTNQTSYILSASKTGYTTNTLTVNFGNADLSNQNITDIKTTITAFLSDLSVIVTALKTMFTAVMLVFMEPPLSLFIGVALFAFIIGIVGRYMLGKAKGLENKRFISSALTTQSRTDARTQISNILEGEFKAKLNAEKFKRIEKETNDLYEYKRSKDRRE